jgi:hypothetical protein
MAIRRFSYAKLGRAGLGNELFPYLRSLDFAEIDGARLVPPRWFKLRIGPWLRQERDRRRYWLFFRRPSVTDRFLQVALDSTALSPRYSGHDWYLGRWRSTALRAWDSFSPISGRSRGAISHS